MATYPAGTRADAIRLLDTGTEVRILSAAGAIPGTTPLAAGGANGPGRGDIEQDAAGQLRWRAPGSATWGDWNTITGDGSYVLEDGDDPGAFLRVYVATAHQVATPAQAAVYLQDRYNELGPDDVSAAEASAGLVESWSLTVENQGAAHVRDLLVWIDAAVSGLEISDDGATWVAPTSEGAALALDPDLAPGGTDTLHLRRTVGAAAASDPAVTHLLHTSYSSL